MNEIVSARPAPVPGSFGNPVPNTVAELAKVPIGSPLRTLEEVVLFGRALAFAGLLPESLNDRRTGQVKVADVVLLLCMGAELDLSPMQAIGGIYVVKGRPMLSAQLWGTRVRKFGHKLEVIHRRNGSGRVVAATCIITRGDDGTVHEEEFTVWDALAAGLVNKVDDDGKVYANGPWQAYTKTMLRNRAISHCARFACPEVIYGTMGIQGEEYDELADEEGFGTDRFVAGRMIEGTPAENEALADELQALAERMGGAAAPKKVSEVLETLTVTGAEGEAREVLAELQRRAETLQEGSAVPEHTGTRLCVICEQRFFPGEHQDEDHDPAWAEEVE